MAPSKYVGVDGCKGGWFSVGLDQNGNFCESRVFEKFGQLLEHYKDAELILVDMPIGLPEEGERRDCDGEAKRKIYPRSSSVFPAPTRVMARKIQAGLEFNNGLGISSQTFSIGCKTAEVDEIMANRTPNRKPQVREVHPELCFWALGGGNSLKSTKDTLKGKTVRLSILQAVDYRATKIFEKACSRVCNSDDKDVGKIDVGLDDILDALAAAVTAYKGHDQGTLQKLPTLPEGKDPPTDLKKLPMEMVYWKYDPKAEIR